VSESPIRFPIGDTPRNQVLSSSPKRDGRLDFLRGLCLVVMTINHLPRMPLHKLTYETFGYITAAEGFVLISGLTAGWIYSRKSTGRILLRCGYLYLVYCLLTCLLSMQQIVDGSLSYRELLISLAGIRGGSDPAGLLLMYVLLFLVLPIMLRAFKNGRAPLVLYISFGLWLLGQWRLGYGIGVGYLFSWQFLFVIGAWFGYARYRGIELPEFSSLRLLKVAAAAFTIFFFMRHPIIRHPILALNWQVTSKEMLGMARLLNVGLLAFLVSRIPPAAEAKWGELPPFRALRFLGRHSLQVFVYHALILYAIKPYAAAWGASSVTVQLLITSGVILSLFMPAYVHQCLQSARVAHGTLWHFMASRRHRLLNGST